MPLVDLVESARSALWLSLAVAMPFIAVAGLVGLVTSAFQAASQLQDPTLAHLPRIVALGVMLALLGPWAGSQIATFAARLFALAAAR